MSPEDRFNRIEHVTAALVEERRKDREEYRQLWRDTQRQIAETNAALERANASIDRLASETRAAIERTFAAIERETLRAKDAEQQLRDRVDSVVSAIGDLISRLPPRA